MAHNLALRLSSQTGVDFAFCFTDKSSVFDQNRYKVFQFERVLVCLAIAVSLCSCLENAQPTSTGISSENGSLFFSGGCSNPVYENDGSLQSFQAANPTCVIEGEILDASALTYSIGSAHTCSWLSVSGTGVLTGAPSVADVGTCNLSVQGTDGSETYETEVVSVEVKNYCLSPTQVTWVTYNTSGAGTVGSPYIICTAQQLNDIGASGCSGSVSTACASHFKLRGDIDMSTLVPPHIPIGGYLSGASNNVYNNFTGNFNGDNYTISNFEITDSGANQLAFIRVAVVGSTVTNLMISSPTVTGATDVGGVLGVSAGTVDNVHVYNGAITGNYVAGGVAGTISSGTVSDSTSSANVVVITGEAGSFCGNIASGAVDNSWATGDVSGTADLGGFCGRIYASGSATRVYATGNVTGAGGSLNCGGLFGYLFNSSISQSGALGDVNCSTNAGGLLGEFRKASAINSITNSFARGSVTSGARAGGLVGHMNRSVAGGETITLSANYFSGTLSGTTLGCAIGETTGAGGTPAYANNYWDTSQCSSAAQGAGGALTGPEATGLTNSQMQTSTNFNTWDFTNIWSTNTDSRYPFHIPRPEF